MALVVKGPTCQGRRCERWGFDPWVEKIPLRRIRQPTPVFLPGESHGQRSLAGYNPWDHKELDMISDKIRRALTGLIASSPVHSAPVNKLKPSLLQGLNVVTAYSSAWVSVPCQPVKSFKQANCILSWWPRATYTLDAANPAFHNHCTFLVLTSTNLVWPCLAGNVLLSWAVSKVIKCYRFHVSSVQHHMIDPRAGIPSSSMSEEEALKNT